MGKCTFRWYLSNSFQEYLWHLLTLGYHISIYLIARVTSFSLSGSVSDVITFVLFAVISDSESKVEGAKQKEIPQNPEPHSSELVHEVFLEWVM